MNRMVLVAVVVGLGGLSSLAEAKGFPWSEHPALKDVPADGARGVVVAGAAPIELPQIQIKADDRGWRFELKDSAAFMALGASVLVGDELVVGKELRKEMKGGMGGTTVQTKNAKGDPSTLNTDNAWVVQLSAWNVKPWAKGVTAAGTASGKIAVVYKGGLWVAGTFKDVPVKYDSHPPLCALSCVPGARYAAAKLLAPATAASKGKPAKLAWTATPSIEMAQAPLAAELDGKKATPTELSLTGNDKGWYLSLQAKDGEKTLGASIKLVQTPVAGARFV